MDRIFNEKDLKNIMKTKFEIGQQVYWVMVGKVYKFAPLSIFLFERTKKLLLHYKPYLP